MSNIVLAENEKQLGNELYQKKKFEEAIIHYDLAINYDPSNHIYYSNKSACLLMAKDYLGALDAIKKCIEIKPDFSKGMMRMATIYEDMGKIRNAIKTYTKVIGLEKTNEVAFQKLEDLLRDEKKVGEWYQCVDFVEEWIEEDQNELLLKLNELFKGGEWNQITELRKEIDKEEDEIKKSKELLILAKALKQLGLEYRSVLKESIELYPSKETLMLLQSA